MSISDSIDALSHAEREQRLWTAFARAVRNNTLAEGGMQILRIAGMLILARGLDPAEFGLLRILIPISALAILANEAGIPDALIQRKELSPDHLSTAWWISMMLALLTSAGLYACAPLIGSIMRMPRLPAATRLLCIPVLLEGSAAVANAQLRRRLQYGVLALAEGLAEAAFVTTAVLTLALGFRSWSLACGMAARLSVHAGVIWTGAWSLPFGRPRLWAARDLGRFSVSVLGGRVVLLLSNNADFILVGRLLGSASLGAYGMAWDLLRFIPDRLYRVVGRVTLPAFCQIQDDNPQLGRAYCNFVDCLSRIILPIIFCAALAAPELIGGIYGTQWLSAALPLRLLTPGLALAGLRIGIGSIFYTKDHPAFDIYLHSARLLLIVGVVLACAPRGLAAVSFGMTTVEGLISVAGQMMTCGLIGLAAGELVRAASSGLGASLLCSLACVAGLTIAKSAQWSTPVALAAAAIPAGLAFFAAHWGSARGMIASSGLISPQPREQA